MNIDNSLKHLNIFKMLVALSITKKCAPSCSDCATMRLEQRSPGS